MQREQQKRGAKTAKTAEKWRIIIGGTAIVLLAVLLCISMVIRSNIQDEYAEFRRGMIRRAYESASQLNQLYERIDDASVDVPGKLLPEMRAQYGAVRAISLALIENGFEREAPLDVSDIAPFDAAFESLMEAYRRGDATGLARADLGACIGEMAPRVEAYFMPAEEEEVVPVIDASTGKRVDTQNP